MMTRGLCLSKTSKCLNGWELYCSDSSFFRCSFLLWHSAPCSIFRSQAVLRLENLALRHQIGVLQRSAGKRPRLAPADRLLWVWLSRPGEAGTGSWPSSNRNRFMAWHRAGFRSVLDLERSARPTRDDLSFHPLGSISTLHPFVSSQSLIVLDETQLAVFTSVNHYCIV
jgi:hypothetical protein